MRPGPEATDHRVRMLMSGMPVLIQGDSGGNICILWRDTVGPCEGKKSACGTTFRNAYCKKRK